MMDKKFKPCDRDQMYLLPPSLQDWLPEGHLAYFIVEVVDGLDLSEIYSSYGGDGRGQPPYDPAMMTALLLYAYCVGLPSSRKIERACVEDIAFRVIAANQHPDHDSISSFRHRHLSALAGLFLQILHLCREAGLVKMGHVALDGTKVRANASKHKAMSYKRMQEKSDELELKVKELLDLAERVDAEEDGKYGKGVRGDELPAELRTKQGRLKKIKEAMAALEAKARAASEAKATEARQKIAEREEKAASGESVRGRSPEVPDPAQARPDDKAQRNFTDPESRIMKDGATKSFEQCYNAQAAVDGERQVIVAAEVTQAANDKEQLEPMVAAVAANTGAVPETLTADAGYYSEANVRVCETRGIDGYIAVGRIKHGEAPPLVADDALPDLPMKERMRRKLLTERGREVYAKRKAVAEPVFGQIKQARGLRRFLLRGLANVSAEWKLWSLGHNLLKLYRFGGLPVG